MLRQIGEAENCDVASYKIGNGSAVLRTRERDRGIG